MIEQYDNLKGYFCIQCIKDNKVVDQYEDHNFIMVPARRSMAELFVGAKKDRITALKLGYAGFFNDQYNPITEATGFSRERTCLYTESLVTKTKGSSITIRPGELVKIGNDNITIYQFKGSSKKTVTLSDSVLQSQFNVFPYPIIDPVVINAKRYTDVNFTGTTNYAQDPTKGGIYITFEGGNNTTVQYTFEVPSSEGNTQQGNYSLINEACIYINGRIFCMKCFPSKLKDDSTTLKIIWKIIF